MLTIEKEVEEVKKLRDEDKLTFEAIGSLLGFSEKTASRRYKGEGIVSTLREEATLPEDNEDQAPIIKVKSAFLPKSEGAIKRFKPLIRTGNCMLTADFHIPLHDTDFINVMINCAKKNKIDKLIIAGDFFHMEAFSSFLPHQPEASWKTERYEGNFVMKTLLKTFKEIDFIWGNHDFRVVKATGFKESFIDCMKWALNGLTDEEMDRINFSDLDYMDYYPVEGSERMIRVCHPQNFSKVPLTVPRELSIKYATGVASAHSHHCSLGVAANGVDLMLELGGFFHKGRTEYIQRTNTSHEWVQGFFMFKDGIPHMISPTLGNHKQYIKEVK